MICKFRVGAGVLWLAAALPAYAGQAPLADLVAAEPTEAGLNVTVPTGGCTKKADFEVSAQPPSKGPARIEIRRLKNDYCKGNFPDGIKLSFTWDELKLPSGTKLTVANKVEGSVAQPQEARRVSVKAHKKFKKKCKRKAHGKRCKARHLRHRVHKVHAANHHHRGTHRRHHRHHTRISD
jgi:hypothetical protein